VDKVPAAKLEELGERAIIREYLKPRYSPDALGRFGDDCADIYRLSAATTGTIVITTDPCPQPAATLVGYTDFYYWGWLLAAINLSDIAAAGATPLGLVTSLILPNEFLADDFARLLDGIDACCAEAGTRVVGGNIRDGDMSLVGTAVGLCRGRRLSRVGCKPGQSLLVVGEIGNFWAAVCALKSGIDPEDPRLQRLLPAVLTPRPKVGIGRAIGEQGLATSCMDNSDGLYSSLVALAEANGVGFELELNSFRYHPAVLQIADELHIDPVRFAMGWGDWQLLCTVDESDVAELAQLGAQAGVSITRIGRVSGGGAILSTRGKQRGLLDELDSQRFTSTSDFNSYHRSLQQLSSGKG
jgi:thiamine-monophosphate kinase